MKASKVVLGLLIICLGIFLLGVNLDLWNSAIILEMWRLWPILIIFLGLRLAIKNDLFFITFSLVALIIALILSILFINHNPKQLPQSNSGALNSETGKADSASYKISLGAANIDISSFDEGGLFSGNYKNLGKIETKQEIIDNKAEISLKEDIPTPFWGQIKNRQFELNLAKNIPTEVDLATGASSFNLDFSKINLTKFNIESGATSGTIKLGKPNGFLSGAISTGASSYQLLIPKKTSIKITVSGALNSQNFEDFGLTKEGKNYFSKDFDNATDKIFIDIESGVSSINIKNY